MTERFEKKTSRSELSHGAPETGRDCTYTSICARERQSRLKEAETCGLLSEVYV